MPPAFVAHPVIPSMLAKPAIATAAPNYDVLSRHVKLPTFSGTTNVETFILLFEQGCDTLGIVGPGQRLTLLFSNMEGAAADWAGSMAR